jgi:hypothetical protein
VKKLTKKDLRVPGLLLALSAVPMLGGAARLASLSAPATAESARFVATPAPVVIHIVGAALYCLIGAFQFSSGFRRRWPRWHRRAGKVLALCGLSTALTGLWMAAFYPIPQALQGPLTLAVRMVVGAAMFASIVLAWRSILRRDVARHEAWMIRAYALGQGAGTQAVIMLPIIVLTGDVVGLTRDLLMTLAWAINVVVAEWIIRRRTVESMALRVLEQPSGHRPGGEWGARGRSGG